MAPKVRKYVRKSSTGVSQTENQGETKTVDVNAQQTEKNDRDEFKEVDGGSQFDKLLSSPPKQSVQLKPLGFWSKKLQDLQQEEIESKKTKCGLYDFSASEDSFSPNKEKRKQKKRNGVRKKKQTQPPGPGRLNYKKPVKKKVKTKMSDDFLVPEKPAKGDKLEKLNRENKENVEVNSDRKPVFLTPHVKLGNMLTSTPHPFRTNLARDNHFLCLSPIEMRDVESACVKSKVSPPPDRDENEHEMSVQTPKISHRKKKVRQGPDPAPSDCVRVLRSRKVLVPN